MEMTNDSRRPMNQDDALTLTCNFTSQELLDYSHTIIGLEIKRCGNPEADHHKASRDLIFYLISKMEHHAAHQLEPYIFSAGFNGKWGKSGAFTIRLPTPLKRIALHVLRSDFTMSSEEEVNYRLSLAANYQVQDHTRSKEVDSGSFNFGWINFPQDIPHTRKEIEALLTTHLTRARLRLKSLTQQRDKRTGTATMAFRFTFELEEGFGPGYLRGIRWLQLGANGTTVKISLSEQFCTVYKVHQECLKLDPRYVHHTTPPGLICDCSNSTQVKGGKAVRDRAIAKDVAKHQYRERMKRRLMEAKHNDAFAEEDPSV